MEPTGPPEKRRRGNYKSYLIKLDGGPKIVPESTLRRRKKQQEQQVAADQLLQNVDGSNGSDASETASEPESDDSHASNTASESESDDNQPSDSASEPEAILEHPPQNSASSSPVPCDEDIDTASDHAHEGGDMHEQGTDTDECQHELSERSEAGSEEIDDIDIGERDERQETEQEQVEQERERVGGREDVAEEAEVNDGARNKSYADKHHLNEPLHQNSPHSRLEVLLMILYLAIRHCQTQHFVEDLIKFVNALFGLTVLDVSWYIFSTLFPHSEKFEYHYFCSECETIVDCHNLPKTARATNCPDCGKVIRINTVDSKDYFLTLSVREQIENLLKRPNIKLVPRRQRNNNDAIADIFDGELFKNCSKPGFPFDGRILTCTFNTDGVRVFELPGLGSLYPIFLHLNEIVPELRFKTENLILGGLWFGKGSPNMALFLKPFLEQVIDLSLNGVLVPQPDGETIKCPVFALCCSVDSVCKPKLVCQHQFNGAFSCLYCHHPNDAVADLSSSNQKHFDTSVSYPLRTEESVMRDMQQADDLVTNGQLKKGSVQGFLGISVLLIFSRLLDTFPCNPFHIVWSVVIDYMHALLEGVCGNLLELYQTILSSDQLETVNHRLEQITLPDGMSRKPRCLDGNIKYKAKESRSFFLYFAVPCFQDLLPRKYFDNLKLFVNALHILLSDSISRTALSEAERDMKNFVQGFQRLFGLEKVTYNLHLCLHLCELVKQVGPLWAYSNFIFESGNGLLLRLVRGTRSVIHEIAVKYTRLQAASLVVSNNPVSAETLEFCSDVLQCKFSKQDRYGDVSVTGSQSYMIVSDEEMELLQEHNVVVTEGRVKVFNRIIRKGIKYTSKAYSKAKTTNDSCVLLNDGSYAIIDKIVINSANVCLCLMKPVRLATANIHLKFMKVCSSDVFGDLSIVPFDDISKKCVFLSFQGKHFVCHIPNFYERD